jgi:hypothetical protein
VSELSTSGGSTFSLFGQAAALLDDSDDEYHSEHLSFVLSEQECDADEGYSFVKQPVLVKKQPVLHPRKRDKVRAYLRRTFQCFVVDDEEADSLTAQKNYLWHTGKLSLAQPDWETSMNLTFGTFV